MEILKFLPDNNFSSKVPLYSPLHSVADWSTQQTPAPASSLRSILAVMWCAVTIYVINMKPKFATGFRFVETERWLGSKVRKLAIVHNGLSGLVHIIFTIVALICRFAWLIAILLCIGVGTLTSEGFFAAYFRRDTSTRFKNIQSDQLQVRK